MLTGKPEIVDGKPRDGAKEPLQAPAPQTAAPSAHKQLPAATAPPSPAAVIAERLRIATVQVGRLRAAYSSSQEHTADLERQMRMAEGALDELLTLARALGIADEPVHGEPSSAERSSGDIGTLKGDA